MKKANPNRWKRPLAVICLVLIGILAIGAIVLAFWGTEMSRRLLIADLFCLMVVPAVFYGYQMFLNLISKKDEDSKDQD